MLLLALRGIYKLLHESEALNTLNITTFGIELGVRTIALMLTIIYTTRILPPKTNDIKGYSILSHVVKVYNTHIIAQTTFLESLRGI